LCGRIRFIVQEPLLDALYDGASKVGCSGCVFEVFRKLIDELVKPICSRVAEVQMRYGFGLNALRAGISRSAASAFPDGLHRTTSCDAFAFLEVFLVSAKYLTEGAVVFMFVASSVGCF
jgi:hypothetical protein